MGALYHFFLMYSNIYAIPNCFQMMTNKHKKVGKNRQRARSTSNFSLVCNNHFNNLQTLANRFTSNVFVLTVFLLYLFLNSKLLDKSHVRIFKCTQTPRRLQLAVHTHNLFLSSGKFDYRFNVTAAYKYRP